MTHGRRAAAAVTILALALAACGGGAAATNGGPTAGPTTGGGTEPTGNLEPTQDGGGGDLGFGNGRVTFEVKVDGQLKAGGELPFSPLTSIFDPSGSSLTYALSSTDEVLIITLGAGGVTAVTYGTSKIAVSGTECKVDGLTLTTANASGTFDCTKGLVTTETGMNLTGISFKGTFEARK